MNRILNYRQSGNISGRNSAGAVRISILRSVSVILICVMLIITFGYSVSPAAWAVKTDNTASSTASALTPTVISGYKTSIRKMYKQDVTISAEIYPAAVKRKVKLQRYNSTEQKWETIKKEYVKSQDSSRKASVTFSVDREYRQKANSRWRIKVNAKGKYAKAISSDITLTTTNLKGLSLSARSAVIYRIDGNGRDGRGTYLYTKGSNVERAQASTTKLMTAILVMESGRIGNSTTISKHAAATPWSGTFRSGDTYTNTDLMYALLMPSANDAATALAEGVAGSEDKFVQMMNDKAVSMGFTHTHFRNPHGLDASGHYTTAKELAKLTAYAYTYPQISTIWNTKYRRIYSTNTGRRVNLWTTNAIFGYDKHFRGGKTGTTGDAACCFTGVYRYKGHLYVTTVLGSSYGFSRWADTKKLHSYIKKYASTSY